MKINKLKLQIAMANALMSIKTLANKARMDAGSISHIMAKGGNCKQITAGKIAKALGVDVKEIIDAEP